MTTMTPSMARGIHLTPRTPPFEFRPEDVPPSWMGGDVVATAAWDALSVIASAGEKLFVEAGRYLIERIGDPVVAAETRAFLQQEGIHSAVHARFNRLLASRGRPVDAIERFATDLLDGIDRYAGRATMLSAALAGEQMIGEIGHAALERPEALEAAADAPRALWQWHFYEEVEHQAALHDGWMHVYGRDAGGHATRVLGAVYVATTLAALWPAATYAMLPPEHRQRARELPLGPLVRQMLGRRGLLRGAGRNVLELLRADFHPFDLHHDPAASLERNQHLVDARWERPPPSAGRHGVEPHGAPLESPGARDLAALARFTAFALRRTRAFLREVEAGAAG